MRRKPFFSSSGPFSSTQYKNASNERRCHAQNTCFLSLRKRYIPSISFCRDEALFSAVVATSRAKAGTLGLSVAGVFDDCSSSYVKLMHEFNFVCRYLSIFNWLQQEREILICCTYMFLYLILQAGFCYINPYIHHPIYSQNKILKTGSVVLFLFYFVLGIEYKHCNLSISNQSIIQP